MRTYGQFCPIARGSEILAERWTPIILRNLLLGCRTFNEIAGGAPGLSRALLTKRLRQLERAGVIEIRSKPDGRGSLYEPTPAGRDLWGVLQSLSAWAQRWTDIATEHAEPDAVLWSWVRSFVRRDLLPEGRVVVRFDFRRSDRRMRAWLLIEHREAEICLFDPGFGDDLIVDIRDPLAFARWHLGLVTWEEAVREGGLEVDGPRNLRDALPTWNSGPAVHARKRAESDRAPGAAPPLPLEAPERAVVPEDSGRRSDQSVIAGFEGRVVRPGDADYDRHRAVWNGAVDRRPRYIARCSTTEDVQAALRFARERSMEVAVRGGGHGVAGGAVCDDGLVIDLSGMKAIQLDPANRTVVAEAGLLWGELDAATQAFGLATTGGVVSHTGISGLTLGGGIGWLMRRHGLTVDNLLSAELVTAEGERLRVDEEDEPDLFWGLRGAGAQLGITTSFRYRLHRVGPEVLAGPVIWDLEDAPAVLRAYRETAASSPGEVATVVTLRRAPPALFLPGDLHRRPVCMISMMAITSPENGERLLAPLRSIGRPLIDLVKRRPYRDWQSMFDGVVPHGWHYYWKSTGLRSLDDGVVDTLADHAARAASPWSYAILFHLDGAVAEADPDATAYSRRDVPFELNVNAVWLPHESIGASESAWARGFVDALGTRGSGAYVNFLDRDDAPRSAEAFSAPARGRLADIKRRYDPDGVFPGDPSPTGGAPLRPRA